MDEIKINSDNIASIDFKSVSITEDIFNSEYEYKCNYDLNIKYKNISTGDRKLDEYLNTKAIHDKNLLSKTYDSRPSEFEECGALTKEDIKLGKEDPNIIDSAIQDFLDMNMKDKPGVIINLITDIFNYDIPNRIFQNVVSDSKIESADKNKVKNIEYDYRKDDIKRITIYYENGDSVTVETKTPVTNKTIDNVVPGLNILSLYFKLEDWFEEDYDKAIEILNNIFGFDLETLKGAKVIW